MDRDYTPDQKAWLTREKARKALLRPGEKWRSRSNPRFRVTIREIRGAQIYYSTLKSPRWPKGVGDITLAAFMRCYTPVSTAWMRERSADRPQGASR